MNTNKEMAAFFDRLAPDWDNTPDEYDVREKLTSMMNLFKDSVIADIGCGKGVMFEHLLKYEPKKIIAVDISGEMLQAAENHFRDDRIEYINDDVLNVPLPMLDFAVIFNAYPHFTDKKALAEKMAQHVKKDGVMIIAHSRSKSKINGRHRGDSVSKLSVALESAEDEAKKFSPFFTADTLIDDDIYFIKMTRV